MSDVESLNKLIKSGALTFDPSEGDLLRKALLGISPVRPVTQKVQSLVVALCAKVSGKTLKISSLIRDEGHHGEGRAVDFGNEEIAGALLPGVATQAEVDRLEIDELIFDATRIAGEKNANKYNFNAGKPHQYDIATIAAHRNHIHFSVRK